MRVPYKPKPFQMSSIELDNAMMRPAPTTSTAGAVPKQRSLADFQIPKVRTITTKVVKQSTRIFSLIAHNTLIL